MKIKLEWLLMIPLSLPGPTGLYAQAKPTETMAAEAHLPAKTMRDRGKQQPGVRCDAIKKLEYSNHSGGGALSPNGERVACMKENILTRRDTLLTNIYLEDGHQWTWLAVYEDVGPGPMPVWSPDSSRFAFNYTTGGATCCWYVDVFDINTKRHHDIGTDARRANSKLLNCEAWNMYLDKWHDATSIIVWLECWQPPRDEFGRGYLLNVRSGKILERYDAKETRDIMKESEER
jgi:hypothetical protein